MAYRTGQNIRCFQKSVITGWYQNKISVYYSLTDHPADMKHYLNYQPDELAWDTSFRQWVLFPTRENDSDWQNWLGEHPEKVEIVRQARTMVQALQLQETDLSEAEIKYAVQRTMGRIRKSQPDGPTQRIIPFYRNIWFQLAAMLILISGVGIGLWLVRPAMLFSQVGQTISYSDLTSSKTLTETVNQSAKPMPVKLDDGSLIILRKGSRISYSPSFNGTTREVYLSGEGYFEVSKNPVKPFLIYANGLVTKVLGTSFTIKAYPSAREVTVEVKTGRVAVFAQSDPRIKEKAGSRELEGVVLMPNQKIIYVRNEIRLAKSLIADPQLTSALPTGQRFVFEDTPVPVVFAALEKAYEVDIVYDEQLLANCPLTATLIDQPLFDKLDIICRVIEAHYELIDGQIVIHSRGCKP